MSAPYRLAADTFGPEEIEAAKAVLDSGNLTMGEKVAEFERAFAQRFLGPAYSAIMVNSGSSANLLMVDAMLRRTGREPPWRAGDEVVVPALTWPTAVWPLAQLGLVPVLADVDRDTLALDPSSAESVISTKTRGLFVTHVLGRAAEMRSYDRIRMRHDFFLLEDACESLGAHDQDANVGSFGDMASFSLYFSHHLSTIEGGVVVTRDAALADDLRSLRAHGWVRERSDRDEWARRFPDIDRRFLFAMPGYNVRPTEIQAAIGLVQLCKLDAMIEGRRLTAGIVKGLLLHRLPWLELIGADTVGANNPRRSEHSWMMLPFRVRADAPVEPVEVRRLLEEMGVETRPIIAGNLVRHPAMSHVKHRCAASLAVADEVFERGFMIGCHPHLKLEQLDTLERAFNTLRCL